MHMNDPLGDMLTRIRNASMRGKSTVRTPASKIRVATKPIDAALLFRLITGYSATAVPMQARAVIRSKSAPSSTWESAPALRM